MQFLISAPLSEKSNPSPTLSPAKKNLLWKTTTLVNIHSSLRTPDKQPHLHPDGLFQVVPGICS